MTKRFLVVTIACALASPALADNKEDAKKQIEAAAAAYKEGRFEDTLNALNEAYKLDPKPELHYSIGQVYVKLNRCSDAIIAYDNFLASKPSKDRADLAHQAIAACKAQQATTTTTTTETKPDGTAIDNEPPPGMETTPTTTTTAPPTTKEPEGPAPWYKDKLGLGLTGGGVVLTVVGLVLYSSARGKISDAEKADNYGDSEGLYDDAKSQRTTSMIVTVLGLGAT